MDPGATARRGRQLGRRLRWKLARHLMRDRGGAGTPTVIVAGVARSGTTWLADLLASTQPTRVMFEPFYTLRVPQYHEFEYLQYMAPDAESPQLLAFAELVLRGRIRDPGWIDRFAECLSPRLRVIKDIRACLLLRWLTDRFPDVPAVFIVRHPCAVVSSHLAVGWSTRRDLDSILAQPALIEDHLGARVDWIRELRHPFERHAVLWCVGNLVALRQAAGSSMPVVFYEHLVRQPARSVPAVFDALDLDYDPSVLDSVGRRSVTVFKGSPLLRGQDPATAWTRALSPEQVDRVMEIVADFGLDHLYDPQGQPRSAVGSLRERWL